MGSAGPGEGAARRVAARGALKAEVEPRATPSPTRTSSRRWSRRPTRCSPARWSWSAPSSSRRSCAWCCCSRSTPTGASTWPRSTTCARASTCAATRRRTRSRSTSARPSSCSAQLLDAVKMEVTRVLMTVRIQSQEQVAQAAEAIEERAEPVGNVTYTHPNEDGSVSEEADARHRRSLRRAQGRPQRPLPLRQRQEVQALPRQVGLTCAVRACNRAAPTAADLHAVAGVRIGVAMAGMRKADRKDLVRVRARRGRCGRRRVHAQPLLRGAGAGVPRAPGAPAAASARCWSTPATPTPAPAPTAWRARGAAARRWPRSWSIAPEQVLPFSTGVIMETLPVERIEAGLPAALADLRADALGRCGRRHHDHRHACPRRRRGSVMIGGRTVTSPASPRAPA